MPAGPPCRDIEDRPRFLVGVQVDVSEHPTTAEATPVGMQQASMVGQALQNMNWCAFSPLLLLLPVASSLPVALLAPDWACA